MARNRRRATRKESYLSKRVKKNKRFIKTAFGLIIAAGVGFFSLNSMMDKEIAELEKNILSSKKKLDDVNKEIAELKSDYEIRNTDEFKEKVAKERLGMVKKSHGEESLNNDNAQNNTQSPQTQPQNQLNESKAEIEDNPQEQSQQIQQNQEDNASTEENNEP